MTIEELRNILQACWSKETCYPKQKNIWNKNNPSLGQCAITSLLVNDYYDGKIGKCYVDGISHYFNIINGGIIDLTKEQFDCVPDYSNITIITRENILNNENTKLRYETLKCKLKENKGCKK